MSWVKHIFRVSVRYLAGLATSECCLTRLREEIPGMQDDSRSARLGTWHLPAGQLSLFHKSSPLLLTRLPGHQLHYSCRSTDLEHLVSKTSLSHSRQRPCTLCQACRSDVQSPALAELYLWARNRAKLYMPTPRSPLTAALCWAG